MTKRTKLELTRIGKDNVLHLEPRILIKKPELSNNSEDSDNMLIHGDNLLALKALEQDYAGKVKCIYIDPPYNTGNAFEHYDDGLEHSEWLNLMKPRLEILRNLLSDDGSIFVQLDDNEMHYCKVIMDEIFGRNNFITNIIRHKKRGKDNSSRYFSTTHDHILVYAKNSQNYRINRTELEEQTKKAYKNPDNDSRGIYRLLGLRARQQGGSKYAYTLESGQHFEERDWLVNFESMKKLEEEKRLVATQDKLYRKLFISENKGSIPETIRLGLSNNANAKDELKKLNDNILFDTPKPEHLINRIIEIASNPGDLVLDSFLGSGTTAAVAHKMGRRWIGIELGDHAYTHAKVRMDKVIEGEQGGISKAVGWNGGGGYSFYELGPSLLTKDEHDNYIINPELDANKLMQALCKIEHFTYSPSDDNFIKHGYSTEQDFIHITTRLITQELLDEMSQMLSEGESLLILSRHVAKGLDFGTYHNIQVKKIPQAIMNKCEYDRDDYSLPITETDYQDDDDTEE